MIRAFLVRGRSMAPGVPDKSLILVRPLKREPQPGEVVVYWSEEGEFPVVHRLLEKTSGGWRLQGDNNCRPDPWPVPQTSLVGRVCCVLPRLGRWLNRWHRERWS